MSTICTNKFRALSEGFLSPLTTLPTKEKVLHVSLEGPNAVVGGVGSVIEDLINVMQSPSHKAIAFTPFYSYMENQAEYQNRKLVGCITHLFDGQSIVSEIYKVKVGQNRSTQYLIRPSLNDQASLEYKNIFQVATPKAIYEHNPAHPTSGTALARSHYLGAAAAAFAATYCGKTGTKKIGAIHIHNVAHSIACVLTAFHYNAIRQAKKLSPVKTLLHNHGVDIIFTFKEPTSIYKNFGLTSDQLEYDHQKETLRCCDRVIYVSDDSLAQALDVKVPPYKEQIQALHKKGALFSVLNGIKASNFDIRNKKKFGEFAADLSSTTSDHPVIEAKCKAKQALYDAGLISDPKKPLFYFVGRFCDQKGLDILEQMAQEILAQGGNLIVMGSGDDPSVSVQEGMPKLRKLEKDHKGQICILDSFDKQKKLIGPSMITTGDMVRIASDGSLIPSRWESCCLVGEEGLASANLLVTTGVGGMMDYIDTNTKSTKFNAVTFTYEGNDLKKTYQDARDSVKRTFDILKQPIEKRETIFRNILLSSETYDWEKGIAKKKLTSIYNILLNPPRSWGQAFVQASVKVYSYFTNFILNILNWINPLTLIKKLWH